MLDEKVYEVKSYVRNQDGKQFRIDMLSCDEETLYYAQINIGTSRGPVTLNKEIAADDIESAFELFESTAETAVKEFMQQAATPKVIVPGASNDTVHKPKL